jgi:hypothetical protein
MFNNVPGCSHGGHGLPKFRAPGVREAAQSGEDPFRIAVERLWHSPCFSAR